ncbi:MAG: hypothetical protein JO092_09990 [Candidatus Eremiobacteraeota bacterium]|nr:hypothetical protein [Candidatus Eremiobacteraeota bacterium]
MAVAALAVQSGLTDKERSERFEPVYGGYANARGDIVLFVKDGAYRVNFKSQTLQRRPALNSGAQARYDATEAGDGFEFGSKTFRRLSHEQIVGICASHRFRVISIPVRS